MRVSDASPGGRHERPADAACTWFTLLRELHPTLIPKPSKQKIAVRQESLASDEGLRVRNTQHHSAIGKSVCAEADKSQMLRDPADWDVMAETAGFLEPWRHSHPAGVRTAFCQFEAVDGAVWLAEIAPQLGRDGQRSVEDGVSRQSGIQPWRMNPVQHT